MQTHNNFGDDDLIGGSPSDSYPDEAMQGRQIKEELITLIDSNMPFTDLLLEQDGPVMAKTPDGWMVVESMDNLDANDMENLLRDIDTDWEGKLSDRTPINRPIELSKWRLRANAYLAFSGAKKMIAIRRIPRTPPTLTDTGLPASMRFMIEAPRGLILISGATGAGKTTTMAALVDEINSTRNAHIITIEDPIEYIFTRKKSTFSQREVGIDTKSFSMGVEESVRQTPNVIVIGEIRDYDTANAAFFAGESGHLVIGSLHASSAAGALQKILGWFPDSQRSARCQALSSMLVGVVSQILLPRNDGKGYALAAELLFNHRQKYSSLISSNEISKIQGLMGRDKDDVSVSMADSLFNLVKDRRISKYHALQAVAGHTELLERLKGIEG